MSSVPVLTRFPLIYTDIKFAKNVPIFAYPIIFFDRPTFYILPNHVQITGSKLNLYDKQNSM
jgi:hypothetical protein